MKGIYLTVLFGFREPDQEALVEHNYLKTDAVICTSRGNGGFPIHEVFSKFRSRIHKVIVNDELSDDYFAQRVTEVILQSPIPMQIMAFKMRAFDGGITARITWEMIRDGVFKLNEDMLLQSMYGTQDKFVMMVLRNNGEM